MTPFLDALIAVLSSRYALEQARQDAAEQGVPFPHDSEEAARQREAAQEFEQTFERIVDARVAAALARRGEGG